MAAQIRTIWLLVAMIPIVLFLGVLAITTVVIATPVTLAGMFGWHLRKHAGKF